MEKRSCKRKIKRLNISFSDGNIEHKGISSDFSCNGLFIRTRNGYKEGTILQLMLDIDDITIPMTGIVVRFIKPGIAIIKFGIGIELTSTTPEYDNFIKELNVN